MKIKLTRALVLFFIAYIIVTILAVATTEIYGAITNPVPPAPGTSALQAPVFVTIVPYHVLIMLVIWPIFAALYFKKAKSQSPSNQLIETRQLAFLWLAAAVIVDFVGFVAIKTQYSLTAYEFYVLYQPWITLIYVAIFLSPFIRLWLSRAMMK